MRPRCSTSYKSNILEFKPIFEGFLISMNYFSMKIKGAIGCFLGQYGFCLMNDIYQEENFYI